MRVRCKMVLSSVTKRLSQRYVEKILAVPAHYESIYVYDAKFSVVTGGSGDDDSQKFWEATPSGQMELTTIKDMPWTIGEAHYIDIVPVAELQRDPTADPH